MNLHVDKLLIVKAVMELLEEYPEMRLCQLISNISGGAGQDFFYITDEKFVKLADAFVQQKYAKASVASLAKEPEMSTSERIARILKINPRYHFTYKYYGENSCLFEDYNDAVIEQSRLNGRSITSVYPNFETNSGNLIELLNLFLPNTHFQYDGAKKTIEKIHRYLELREDGNEIIYLQSQSNKVEWDMSEYCHKDCDIEDVKEDASVKEES